MSLRERAGINAGDPTRPRPFEGLVSIPDWYEDALCAQVDTDAFFPEKGGSTRAAKAVCMRCEVREQCLQYALDNDEREGIWGGKSDRERRAIRGRRCRGCGVQIPATKYAPFRCDACRTPREAA